MDLINWANSKLRKLDIWDIKLIKLSTLLIGLTLGAYFASFILPFWWIFIVVAIVLAIRPYYKAFAKP